MSKLCAETYRIGLFCSYLLFGVWGQSYANNHPRLYFEHLDLDLNSNRIESIQEDYEGFIWIGTLDGLHKYDGANITTYLPDNSTGLQGRRIISIFEDSQNRLWIGTEKGLYLYHRHLDQFKSVSFVNSERVISGEQMEFVQQINEDSNGTLWMTNNLQGLIYLQNGDTLLKKYEFDQEMSLSTKPVINCIQIDKADNLWLGTEYDGVLQLNPVQNQIIRIPTHTTSIATLLLTSDKTLWVANKKAGLDKINLNVANKKNDHYEHIPSNPKSIYNNEVVCILEDSAKNIWFGNVNGGLHLYNEKENNFTRFTPNPHQKHTISNISIRTIYEDSQKRIWIGSHLEGIDVIDRYRFKFVHFEKTGIDVHLSHNIVRSIHEDEQGNLWIATDGGGLNHLNRNTELFTTHTSAEPSNPLSSNALLSLETDINGNLWIGSWNGGIDIMNMKTRSVSNPYRGVTKTTEIFSLLRDKQGRMWAANYNGGVDLFSENGRHIKNFSHDPNNPNSIGHNTVLSIFETSKGQFWFGSEYSGPSLLLDMDKDVFKVYRKDDQDSASFPGVIPNQFFEDQLGQLWIASDVGLSKFLPETQNFKNYFFYIEGEALSVKSIAEDASGNLWLGTSKNLIQFDPNQELELRYYTKDDGLQGGEFSRGAVLKTKKGELVFGGYMGFNIFHPDSLRDNPFSSKVHLTGLSIFNEPVVVGDGDGILPTTLNTMKALTLSYDHSVISFDYVGINYTQPLQNKYAYRLVGFEDEWNFVETSRRATYTNLDPGQYTFEIKAANNDGLWNEHIKSLPVTVIPPWWGTWFFRISLFIFLVAVLYGIYQIRIQSLKVQRTELQKAVFERTKEIEAQKIALAQKNQELEFKNETISSQAEELRTYNEALYTLNETLEKRVRERTEELEAKNKQLEEHAFYNSHELRKPVSNILGLVQLFDLAYSTSDLSDILCNLKKVAANLDNKVKEIQERLSRKGKKN